MRAADDLTSESVDQNKDTASRLVLAYHLRRTQLAYACRHSSTKDVARSAPARGYRHLSRSHPSSRLPAGQSVPAGRHDCPAMLEL
jgi:hypothetical protein